MKSILVTGGAGFIGSNFVRLLVNERKDYKVIVLDNLTYAGNLDNIKDIWKDIIFIKGDICNRNLVDHLLHEHSIDTVVNFAAESHVDRSIDNPTIFLETNVLGTQTLLDACKSYWKLSQDKYCLDYKEGVKYIQISTDETYGDVKGDYKFVETTPLSPNSPYSASKAGADHIVMAYHNTYGLPINITRCSNNYGPYQFPEKLIPLVIQKALSDSKIPVYGDGLQIRDWIHVEDHCRGILSVMENGRIGEVYNIGSNNEKTNMEIILLILHTLNKPESLIEHVVDRLGHDRHYAIDSSKIMSELGWSPLHTFEQGIRDTIAWYTQNDVWLSRIISGEYLTNNRNNCFCN